MKQKKLILQSLFLAFLVVGSIWIIRDHRTSQDTSVYQKRQHSSAEETANWEYFQNEGNIFGTLYHITYKSGADMKDKIEEAMLAVDNSLSMFNENSTVSLINSNKDFQTDSLFREVYLLARKVYQITDGCFDPTVGPLVNAWGFGFKNGSLPEADEVEHLKSLIGFDRIDLVDNKIQKEDSLMIMDFSAIAKGFAVDQVAHLLESNDVTNYMVEIGGEVIVKGESPKGKPWRVGIAKPEETGEGGLQEVLELQDKAMATSGNYRNFYIGEDGKKRAHTIDPHSGYPVQHSILSSTVFAPTCAMADAYATAFMVMGLDKAKQVLAKQKQLEVYFICADKDGSYTTYSNVKELKN